MHNNLSVSLVNETGPNCVCHQYPRCGAAPRGACSFPTPLGLMGSYRLRCCRAFIFSQHHTIASNASADSVTAEYRTRSRSR